MLTISSGPTNSMRGAAFLSGVEDAVVIDIGGTTTDVGVIKSGFPREASGYAKVQDFNLCNYVLWCAMVLLYCTTFCHYFLAIDFHEFVLVNFAVFH